MAENFISCHNPYREYRFLHRLPGFCGCGKNHKMPVTNPQSKAKGGFDILSIMIRAAPILTLNVAEAECLTGIILNSFYAGVDMAHILDTFYNSARQLVLSKSITWLKNDHLFPFIIRYRNGQKHVFYQDGSAVFVV